MTVVFRPLFHLKGVELGALSQAATASAKTTPALFEFGTGFLPPETGAPKGA